MAKTLKTKYNLQIKKKRLFCQYCNWYVNILGTVSLDWNKEKYSCESHFWLVIASSPLFFCPNICSHSNIMQTLSILLCLQDEDRLRFHLHVLSSWLPEETSTKLFFICGERREKKKWFQSAFEQCSYWITSDAVWRGIPRDGTLKSKSFFSSFSPVEQPEGPSRFLLCWWLDIKARVKGSVSRVLS